MQNDIAVTVIVTTLNEEANLPRCLAALGRFDEVIVVDSGSQDRTLEIARQSGAKTISFVWNGQYPKKRQWCLDTLRLAHERVFFVDADEVVTQALVDEIAALDWRHAGYFVDGLYMAQGRPLKFGMRNRKLCLFDRRYLAFPVIDDLDIPGMGEIEGHYQPVLKAGAAISSIRRLRHPVHHYAFEDNEKWAARHKAYANWEVGMDARHGWPQEQSHLRRMLKFIFRRTPFKASLFLTYHFILKGGFLEGARNLDLTRRKAAYYKRSYRRS